MYFCSITKTEILINHMSFISHQRTMAKNGLQWARSQKIPLLYQEGIYIGYTCCPILLSLFNRIHVCLNLKNPLVTIAIFNNNLTGITSLSYPK